MEPDAIRPDRDKTGKQKNPRRSHLSSQSSAMFSAGPFDGSLGGGGGTTATIKSQSTASSVAGSRPLGSPPRRRSRRPSGSARGADGLQRFVTTSCSHPVIMGA